MPPTKGRTYVPIYYKDWWDNSMIAALDREGRSIWLDLYRMMWESEERGVLIKDKRPLSVQFLSDEMLVPHQTMQGYIKQFLHMGLCALRNHDGAIWSPVVMRRASILETRRASGSKGGNPKLVKQNKDSVKQDVVKPQESPSVEAILNQTPEDTVNRKDVMDNRNNGGVKHPEVLVNQLEPDVVNQEVAFPAKSTAIVDLWWKLHREYRGMDPVYIKVGKGNYPLAFKKLAGYRRTYAEYEKAFRCGFEDTFHQNVMEPAYAAEKFNTLLAVEPRKNPKEWGRQKPTDTQITDSLDFDHD